ncbi:MAG: pyridoxal phosphate-dependent aminotransferase [candidate division WOR-3 bacterium]|nr:pyridoxal phosphate-dependent aminotransferase [candidate division WOR-3 bacterium]
MKISKRFANVGDSSTLKITAKAKELKKNGEDVAILAAGEPDFDTPDSIKKSAIKAIEDGFTGYTSVRGIIELRELIAEKLKQDNRIDYSPDEIVVTSGAKQGIYNIIQALCDEESDVIVIAPYWVSYIEMIKMTGATPVIFDTSEYDFNIPPEKLEEYITSRTRMIIMNSPSNPTGRVIGKDVFIKLSEIIVRNNIYCISDEIYEKIIYPGSKHFSIASVNNEIRDLTFTVNGFSKAYAMTGWRVGYIAGKKELIDNALKVQTHSTSCASSISQKAAVGALQTDQSVLDSMLDAFTKRRDYITRRVSQIDGLSYIEPQGAFYLFINIASVKSADNHINSSHEVCMRLLEDFKVAVIPGSAFGADDYIRVSYAASMEDIEKGLKRIEKFAEKYI